MEIKKLNILECVWVFYNNEFYYDYDMLFYFIRIGQNIEKSPGDLRRFTVTQTPVENHQVTLVWKTLKE